MKTNYFFPHACKLTGLAMSILLGVMLVFYLWGWSLFGAGYPDGIALVAEYIGLREEIVAGVVMALFSLSLLMACFSKEKDEDEYTAKLRGDALIYAVVINYIMLTVASLILYDLSFLNFMAIALYLIMFLHIVIFNVTLYFSRKSARNEEQS